jgi:hypothetical protein
MREGFDAHDLSHGSHAPNLGGFIFGRPDELIAAAQEIGPSRYMVDEFAAAGEILSSGHTCRQWGVVNHFGLGFRDFTALALENVHLLWEGLLHAGL